MGTASDYVVAHREVVRTRGRARELLCVACEAPASEWAYDHDDPDELASPRGPFSADIWRYNAMCKACHGHFDHWVRTLSEHPATRGLDREEGRMAAWPGRPGDLITMPKPSLTDRVYEDLKARIQADPPEWGPGERLPRIREMVEHYRAKYGASEAPVAAALYTLRREGLIVGRQGAGMFLPE